MWLPICKIYISSFRKILHTHTYKYKSTRINIYVHTEMYIIEQWLRVHIWLHTQTCTHTYTYRYIYIYIYIERERERETHRERERERENILSINKYIIELVPYVCIYVFVYLCIFEITQCVSITYSWRMIRKLVSGVFIGTLKLNPHWGFCTGCLVPNQVITSWHRERPLIRTYTRIQTYPHIDIHACIYTHTSTRTHTCTHTHTHTRTHTKRLVCRGK